MRHLILLFATLAACFTLQSAALRALGGRTAKSESNFFSSVARIQTGIQGTPSVMLLGSSRTGRLPDRTSGFPGVSCMGCDGGSAADVLRAIDQGWLPIAPVLVVEGNTLLRAIGGTESEVAAAIRAPWFQFGTRIYNLGATARPSAFAYSLLLARKIGKAEGFDGPGLPISSQPLVFNDRRNLPLAAERLTVELSNIFSRLMARNTRILLVILPPGPDEDSLNLLIPQELSRRTGVGILDLTKDLPVGAVRLTDSVHMDPPSAAAALRTILANLN